MIVIDASILSKYLLQEPNWAEIKTFLTNSHSLDFVYIETTNAIWKDNYINKKTNKDATIKYNALKILVEDILVMHETKYVMEESFKIAIQEKVPICDVLYVVLSLRENMQLITSDTNQARIAQKYKVKVKLI